MFLFAFFFGGNKTLFKRNEKSILTQLIFVVKENIQILVNYYCSLLGFVVKSVDLMEYKDRLVSVRRSLAPYLLPPLSDDYPPDLEPNLDLDKILIDLEVARTALRKEGRFLDRVGTGGGSGGSGLSSHRNSRQNSPRNSPRNSGMDWPGVGNPAAQRRPSSVSLNSVSLELDSGASSPGYYRFEYCQESSILLVKASLRNPFALLYLIRGLLRSTAK